MNFEKGESYWAIPCATGMPRKVVTVIGRRDGLVSFAQPEPLDIAWCHQFDGREVARIRAEDGDYTVSAACRVDLQESLEVAQIVRPRKFFRAARGFFF